MDESYFHVDQIECEQEPNQRESKGKQGAIVSHKRRTALQPHRKQNRQVAAYPNDGHWDAIYHGVLAGIHNRAAAVAEAHVLVFGELEDGHVDGYKHP